MQCILCTMSSKIPIMRTCPCNVNPLHPTFIWVLIRTASLYVLSKSKKKYQLICFQLKFVIFYSSKNRRILHRCVFVMLKVPTWVCNDDDSSSKVYSSWIFITLPRGNVTLHVAIGPFVNMTFESRPSCKKKWPICGIGL